MRYIYVNSEYLQLAEPFMEKYYGFHSSMFIDEIQNCVENSGIDYMKKIDGILAIDYDRSFREHKELIFAAPIPYKERIEDKFSSYFEILEEGSEEESIITKDDIVYLCLSFMSYVYYKGSNDLFQESVIIDALDIEYQSVLHYKIYPEMLSLYKMILESKAKNNSGSEISIILEDTKTKVKVNSCSWFIDDMEKYFADRFPDLTLDKIDNFLFQFKRKAGRKHIDRNTTNIIWGTYHLLRNHHSRFKDSDTKISNEICYFILNYLDCLEVEHDYVEAFEIKDILKHHLKHQYIPKWGSEWGSLFTDALDKPKTVEEMLNTPPRRYDIYS